MGAGTVAFGEFQVGTDVFPPEGANAASFSFGYIFDGFGERVFGSVGLAVGAEAFATAGMTDDAGEPDAVVRLLGV